ncbi:MAG: DUF433 domain-containing protein [Anaerolineae bacterium]|nr:DUF433 domain-containing protein [Anaerolineae bacterium]
MSTTELLGQAQYVVDRNGKKTAVVLDISVWEKLMTQLFPLGRSIVKTPGVVGGNARIDGTRMAVWGLEEWRRLGWGDEKILQSYPHLTAADLANVWAYVEANHLEIDEAIRQNDLAMKEAV